jgi:hypothetical protein
MAKKTTKVEEGNIFNKLTVLKFSHVGNAYRKYWICKCECGKETITHSSSLKSGHTKSCGCFINGKLKQSKDAAFKRCFCDYQQNAKSRNYDFNLTQEEFKSITLQNCYYCNKVPSQIRYNKTKSQSYIYNGIDRKNNNKGYTLDNCIPCCGTCNQMKNNSEYYEFLNNIKLIYNNLLND